MALDLSFILTVYNKQDFLENTIASLLRQQGSFSREFIFVDDHSSDDSVSLIQRLTRSMENVTVLCNGDNRGPSVRLNQGVRQARGAYLYLLDADDIIPINAAEKMLGILRREKADVIYGRSKKVFGDGRSVLGDKIEGAPPYRVTENPLAYILKGGFVRMGVMATRAVYLAAGGCDERIFIQDESLPIRLCAKADRLVDYDAMVLYWIAQGDGKASSNEVQLHHDGFLAYKNAIEEIRPMPAAIRNKLSVKMVAMAWKSTRQVQKSPYFSVHFRDYLVAKLTGRTGAAALTRANLFFEQVGGVRRMERP